MISKEWLTCTVADIAAPIPNALVGGPFGSNLVQSDYVESGIPVIRGQNMGPGRWIGGEFVFVSPRKAERLRANLARSGDLVFTQRGTLGQVAIVPDKPYDVYLVSQSQMKLTADPSKVNPHFAYYVFSSEEQRDYVLRNAIQTGVPHTNLGILRDTPLLLPSLAEQCAIAEILDSFDDKIELNQRMNETLEGIARATYKSWFVDFDPVRAKMEGRQPYGMDRDVAALFPDSLWDSEVGGVPLGWRPQSLSGFARVNAWTLTAKDELNPILYVDISSVSRGEISERATFERGTEPSRARRRPAHGDTVLSTVRPDRGSYFLCMHPPENLIVSTGFATVTPLRVPWTFLHAAVTREDVFEYLGHMADGAAYPAVRPSVIEDLQIVVPDRLELLNAYHQIYEPMFSHAAANREESKTIASLRDSLLPKLISGEVRIRDAEQMAEAAL